MLKKISIGLGLLALMLSVLLYGMHYGFGLGYDEAYKKLVDPMYHFITEGPTLYEALAAKYSYVAGILVIFLSGKLIKHPVFSLLVSFSSLGLSVHIYWQIYLTKSERLAELTESADAVKVLSPLYSMLKKTYQLDWFCLFFIILLIGIQIAISVRDLGNRNSRLSQLGEFGDEGVTLKNGSDV
jgi:hypothetical protein